MRFWRIFRFPAVGSADFLFSTLKGSRKSARASPYSATPGPEDRSLLPPARSRGRAAGSGGKEIREKREGGLAFTKPGVAVYGDALANFRDPLNRENNNVPFRSAKGGLFLAFMARTDLLSRSERGHYLFTVPSERWSVLAISARKRTPFAGNGETIRFRNSADPTRKIPSFRGAKGDIIYLPIPAQGGRS